jgi:hypothetical protein
MRILFCGDVFGNLGRRILAERLPSLLVEKAIDVCIANAENAAGGKGLTHNIYRKLLKYGVQVVTGGNHSFANQDCFKDLQSESNLLRPLNFPEGNIGKGTTIFELIDGRKIGVVNLLGRVFLSEALDCPFRLGSKAIDEIAKTTPLIIVDFHAEASSEKKAFFHHVDGRVSAVLGTHTHVQTCDECISQQGTAYITDTGMTGSEDSVIGIKKELAEKRFLLQTPVRFEPSSNGPMLNAIIVEIDDRTGKAQSIERVYERLHFDHPEKDSPDLPPSKHDDA